MTDTARRQIEGALAVDASPPPGSAAIREDTLPLPSCQYQPTVRDPSVPVAELASRATGRRNHGFPPSVSDVAGPRNCDLPLYRSNWLVL